MPSKPDRQCQKRIACGDLRLLATLSLTPAATLTVDGLGCAGVVGDADGQGVSLDDVDGGPQVRLPARIELAEDPVPVREECPIGDRQVVLDHAAEGRAWGEVGVGGC